MRVTLLIPLDVALLCSVLTVTPLAAGADDWQAPTTSWGDPQIEGTWDFRTLTPLERPASLGDQETFTEEEAQRFRQQTIAARDVDQRRAAASFDVEGAYNTFWWDWGDSLTEDRRTSLIVDPPDGRLPALTEAAKAERAARLRDREPPVRDLASIGANAGAGLSFDGPEYLGLSERCLIGFNAGPPMAPSAYNNNLRIVQTPDYVVLVTEMIHEARIVPLDGRPHLPDDVRRMTGDARGHWEGDTLVVETTNFTATTPAFTTLVGSYGSGLDLHLTERFTHVAEGRLLYEYTVDAPAVFTRPFTVAIPMKATEGPLYEYACHEGNYAMGGVLRGARLEERNAE